MTWLGTCPSAFASSAILTAGPAVTGPLAVIAGHADAHVPVQVLFAPLSAGRKYSVCPLGPTSKIPCGPLARLTVKRDGAAAPTAASSLPRLVDPVFAVVDVTGEVAGVVDVAVEVGVEAAVFDDDPQAAATSTKATARTAARVGVVRISRTVVSSGAVGVSSLAGFGACATHRERGDAYVRGRGIQNVPVKRRGLTLLGSWSPQRAARCPLTGLRT